MELLQLAPDSYNFYHCPYNPSHSMPHKTLIKHLIKCPDKPPNYKSCIYNISHVMHESKIKCHEEHCANRILFDTMVYESEDMSRPVTVIDKVPTIEHDESWDGLEQTSDVLKDIKKKTISMKAKHGETRSERKKHRSTLHEHEIYGQSKQDNNLHHGLSERSGNKRHIQPLQNEVKPLFIGKRPNI